MNRAFRTAFAASIIAIPSAPWQPAAVAAQNAKRVPDAPLDFDPARPEAVDGWWTNGTELLRLEPNGAYRLWVSQDRFMRPLEVGAWRRDNYVFFDLEPYGGRTGTRHRVTMQKDGGVTELRRDGMRDFRSVASPPRVFGDDVLGAWVSPVEQLLVLENGRYEWRRTSRGAGASGHSGQWITEERVLTLVPDVDNIGNVSLRAAPGPGGVLELEGPNGGRMTRPPEQAAPPVTTGSPEPAAIPPTAPAEAPPAPEARGRTGEPAPASVAPGGTNPTGNG